MRRKPGPVSIVSAVMVTLASQLMAAPFTYQGRLLDQNQPATGTYDLRFRLADAATNGNYVGPALTNATVPVAQGLFTVILDFGDGAFDGQPRWLEIGVRTNAGSAGFTLLSPRQPVTPAPYALFATTAATASFASNLVGGGLSLTNVPATSLSGTIPLGRISGLTSNQFDPATDAAYRGLNDLAAATNVLGAGFNLSANTASLPHLQRALNSGRSVRILWLGDSIGDNTTEAVIRLFERYSLNGIQRGGPFSYGNRYYGAPSAFDSLPFVWWAANGVSVQQNGESVVWGGPFQGGYDTADTLQFWYVASPTNGTATLATSPDGVSWTTRAVVNESNSQPVLLVTNVSFARGSYAARVTAAGRIQYLWPALLDSTSAGAILSTCNAFGRDLSDLLAMGTNNIATLLTNLKPDLIVFEQKKDVWTRSNWPAVKSLFDAYAGTADVCLLSGQISNGPTDYPVPNPTNSSFAVALVDRSIAISNRWVYVDDFSPLADWTGVIVANGFNADNLVHLNNNGKLFAGTVLIKQLGLLDYIFAAGLGHSP